LYANGLGEARSRALRRCRRASLPQRPAGETRTELTRDRYERRARLGIVAGLLVVIVLVGLLLAFIFIMVTYAH
jgi:hypothetical protein